MPRINNTPTSDRNRPAEQSEFLCDFGDTPAPPSPMMLPSNYARPNEVGVRGRSRRQQHREGMGAGAPASPSLPLQRQSTVHPSIFSHLAPSDYQAERIFQITQAARAFADVLDVQLGIDNDGTSLVRLRELVFWAREAILRLNNGAPIYSPEEDGPVSGAAPPSRYDGSLQADQIRADVDRQIVADITRRGAAETVLPGRRTP